ncbi:isoprenylated v-SNARE protein, putative [Entamoeba histolytica HM-1:IMSS-B]|uniref:Isoprenylated v-SNARE protein, putative n=6 Tax=Entamoeba histolytica TaxID=5759 RepID=C4M2U1_ENTH1|nr:isoprenylated v-SNARE protein, putative [Entamoeba histolytica HM-1:IMSS]EMD43644.1 isoprenylated Vsnare protein, putative [Entamoeba histolytica KU27]EMH76393.1 isoprenylated v-SNARE protein, putative [Entamoeba histolytica HM-1:IMSS-B]EMS15078.1 isoprenylated v-SNARE protein [Entamoeba histolytica HM-3:IMSS]ENY64318.1 isoprenylated v-SNARE protein, putative [Entamoeba histolytica HM-1:IMSS-A]GAT95612.1 isoprenylated v-snare protein putative [Entamoeba histolytica]|eukprot:XP_655167.1 isoprenylated v-SNARE protein, putative [Entamoeba histolytica HM-1:IMSS]
MARLYALTVIHIEDDSKTKILYCKSDLGCFGLFQSNTIKEFIRFGFIEMSQRCERDKRMVIKSNEYGGVLFNLLVKPDGLGIGILTNLDYPKNTITYIIHRSFELFYYNIVDDIITSSCIKSSSSELDYLFTHFNNQKNCKLSKEEMIKTELDETNEKMSVLVTKLISREDELQDIVSKSEILSDKSKVFFKKAKKSKRCHVPCVIQ